MIKLFKLDKPNILVVKEDEWLEKLMSPECTKNDKLKYRHKDIKKTLIEETSSKCAYCEDKMLSVAYGDIEHILPKAKYKNLTFAWENLTLSCSVCNNNKLELDISERNMIHPYEDTPEDHIYFMGTLAVSKGAKGTNTISLLELNRAELMQARSERLEKIAKVAEQIFN
ncbi:MAG: hypothetical protein CMF62_05845 [Magnetococcales bacterium]|nr:hypothetical protein [Magnetococcales bacterium]|tara:strand:+ start:209688 stop:210197 length:510 start_codon:yes stop_codon:yes gene_type:complete